MRDNSIGEAEQRIAGGDGSSWKTSSPAPRDRACRERREQRVAIDQGAAPYSRESAVGFIASNLAPAESRAIPEVGTQVRG